MKKTLLKMFPEYRRAFIGGGYFYTNGIFEEFYKQHGSSYLNIKMDEQDVNIQFNYVDIHAIRLNGKKLLGLNFGELDLPAGQNKIIADIVNLEFEFTLSDVKICVAIDGNNVYIFAVDPDFDVSEYETSLNNGDIEEPA